MADSPRSDVDAAAIQSAKQLLRHAVLLSRESRSPQAKADDDHARFEQLRRALEQRPGLRTVAAYLSTATEPGTLELIGWLASRDVQVLLPALSSTSRSAGIRPDWAPYAGPEKLQVGPFSILEPTTPRLGSADPAGAELVICSALAANVAGDRLGRGGGWYDRALSGAPDGVPVWTLLNDEEVLETIPTDPWDIGVDAIVTPTRLVTIQPGPAMPRP
jgi:5-formyltetrahydrofolate cyclo-ligase